MGLTQTGNPGRAPAQPQNISVEIPRNSLNGHHRPLRAPANLRSLSIRVYAEGQRRYVESLSAYARQFLDQMERPRSRRDRRPFRPRSLSSRNDDASPRSTVGTITEIYDYLRVIYATVGVPHSRLRQAPSRVQSSEQICAVPSSRQICSPDDRVMILAPIVRGERARLERARPNSRTMVTSACAFNVRTFPA